MAIPSSYNALCFTGLGADLQVTEKDILPLPANEVLLKVKASSINPLDIQLWRSGLVAVVSGEKGMGRDFSGTIVQVGKDVKGWATGDDIFGLMQGVVGTPQEEENAVYLINYSSLVKGVLASTYISIQAPYRVPRILEYSRMKRRHQFHWLHWQPIHVLVGFHHRDLLKEELWSEEHLVVLGHGQCSVSSASHCP
jgi:hypothetical protein